MDMATSSGAYAIKDAYDSEVLTYINGQVDSSNVYGSTGTPTDIGFAAGEVSPLTAMNRLSRLLDVQNVPTENRWFVADPVFWEQVLDENSKLVDVEFTGDGNSLVRNGRVTDGLIRGFKCYKSNNMPNDSGGTYRVALAGHMSAVATASQISKTEKVRDGNSFADIIRGLHMYGRKVLRPKALASIVYNVD